MLTLVAGLADPSRRREAARSLAAYLGTEDLVLFSTDPELGVLLPAPGFPQTLPEGPAWRFFLAECVAQGRASSPLPLLHGGQAQPALGFAGKDGSVLVLLGGTPRPEVADVCLLLPLLSAALQGERIALTSEGHAKVAREAAAQASAVAQTLDRARNDLAESARRKDEFLATLAHELRNPLAAILNGLQVLQLAEDDESARRAAGKVQDMMRRQIDHLVRLVDDLLEVSRISRGRIELRKERTELSAIVQSAVENSSPLIQAYGHELIVELAPEPLYLYADSTRLAQVLANLLNNSAKYTEPGGHIRLTAEQDGPEVVLRVQDDGLGIPAGMLPQIFDLFVQVDDSLERRQHGLGIGLTLVKKLVEMHGGSVQAHSAGPGRGSEFAVRLPLASDNQAAQRHQPPAASKRPDSLRILVVDDNKEAAESLGLLLEMAGHDIQIVYDGQAAIEAAPTFQPDVVLQDIGMPVMNGYEVARHLRENPATRNVVLVALTGYGQEEDRRRSLEAGFNHHLVKPVEFAMLQEVLASLHP